MPEEWLTINQAAGIAGYHPNYVRLLVRSGAVQARKFGPLWQVSRKALLAYVRKLEQKGERRGPKRRGTRTT